MIHTEHQVTIYTCDCPAVTAPLSLLAPVTGPSPHWLVSAWSQVRAWARPPPPAPPGIAVEPLQCSGCCCGPTAVAVVMLGHIRLQRQPPPSLATRHGALAPSPAITSARWPTVARTYDCNHPNNPWESNKTIRLRQVSILVFCIIVTNPVCCQDLVDSDLPTSPLHKIHFHSLTRTNLWPLREYSQADESLQPSPHMLIILF